EVEVAAVADDRRRVLVEDLPREREAARLHRVLDGVVPAPLLATPLRGTRTDLLPLPLRQPPPRLLHEEVAEERVEAEPGAVAVEREDEHVAPDQQVDERARAGDPGGVTAEVDGEGPQGGDPGGGVDECGT